MKDLENTENNFIALIPSFEPQSNLFNLVKSLEQNGFTVVVVDDGSGQKYDNIFDNLKCKVIRYQKNRGKGYALKTGLKYIDEKNKNYTVVTVDSDGQHRVCDAISLVKLASKYKDTYFLGKRLRNKNMPLRSKIGNYITSLLTNTILKEKIYDTQTGLRAFSSNLTHYMLKIPGNRYEYEMNTLLHAKKNGIKLKEVEIKTIYIDDNKSSHFDVLKDSLKIYKVLFSSAVSSILGVSNEKHN